MAEGAGDGVEAMVMPVRGKTEARSIEASLIRELQSAGFMLVSDRDGSRSVNL
jgi:hypothetical protein